MDYDDKYQGSKIPRPNVFDRIEAEMSMDSLMQEAQPEPEPATRPELEPELEFETEKEPDPASNQVAEEAKQVKFDEDPNILLVDTGEPEKTELSQEELDEKEPVEQELDTRELIEQEPDREEPIEQEPIRKEFIEERLSEFISQPTDTEDLNPIETIPSQLQTSLAHQTFQTAAGNSFTEDKNQVVDTSDTEERDKIADIMAFAKSFSDDLLGQCDNIQQNDNQPPSADLADFELPPYSGSSSGSEPAASKLSPIAERKSQPSIDKAPLAQQASSSQINAAPPSLKAFKELLMSNYSRVSYIFHWKKPIESGVVFAIGFTLIIALTFFSIISVFAYSALGLILASGLIRLYKTVMKTLKKPTETPFDSLWDKVLSSNIELSPDKMHELVDCSVGNLNSSLIFLKQVLLVEDKIATLKIGLLLYLLTYIGSWFNGMTIITIGYLSLFSVPIIYEMNKAHIDEYIDLVGKQVSTAFSMVTSKATALAFGQAASPAGSKKRN